MEKFYEQNRCLVNTTWPKNWLTLVVVIAFILFIILLFMFLNQGDEDTGQITITENAELRTGPNAAYPIIYKIEKGDSFKKVDKQGKWIEVQNRAGTEKAGLPVGILT